MKFEFHPVDISAALAGSEQPVVMIQRRQPTPGPELWTNWYVLDSPLVGRPDDSPSPWARQVEGTHVAVPLFEYSTVEGLQLAGAEATEPQSESQRATALFLLALELGLRAGRLLPPEQAVDVLKVYFARTRPDPRAGKVWASYFGLAARWARP